VCCGERHSKDRNFINFFRRKKSFFVRLLSEVHSSLNILFSEKVCCVLNHRVNREKVGHLKYFELTLSEKQHLFKIIYSMMPIIQIHFLLYKMEAGKTEWGESRRGGGEKLIKGVRDGA